MSIQNARVFEGIYLLLHGTVGGYLAVMRLSLQRPTTHPHMHTHNDGVVGLDSPHSPLHFKSRSACRFHLTSVPCLGRFE
jgi:hypothetical protein